MRKLGIVLVPLLVLAFVVGAVGCDGGEGKATPTPTPTPTPTSADALPSVDDIIANMLIAQGGITTFRSELSLVIDMEISGPEGGRTVQSVIGRGVIDLLDREMESEMNFSVVAPDEETDTRTASYFAEDTLYMMTEIPGIGEQWTQQPLSAVEVDVVWDTLAEYMSPSLQAGFLEACHLDLAGVVDVGGVPCYLLEGNLDGEALLELIERLTQQGIATKGMTSYQASPFDVAEMYRDARISYWVSVDTYLTLKSEMTAAISKEWMDTNIEGDLVQTGLWYDYGKDMVIEIPPEAMSATDTPSTATPTTTDSETFSKYGFSFQYPMGFSVTEKGGINEQADDSSGLVTVSRTYRTGPFTGETERFEVNWFPDELLEVFGSLDEFFEYMLDYMEDGMEGSVGAGGIEFERGELVETTKSGHRMLYQYWHVTDSIGYRVYGSDKAYGIMGVFYCDSIGRIFILSTTNTTISAKGDVLEDFMTYLDSFVCH